MSVWYERPGREDDCVISTRIRLARNLKDLPFPARMSEEQKLNLNQSVYKALQEAMEKKGMPLHLIQMENLSELEALAMVERRCISPEFARERKGRALLLSDDESVSIMLGEEDHIRIQTLAPGFALDEAYSLADGIDHILGQALPIAFDKNLGFLTACPTNLGTGLRASVMLHLPALESRTAIGQITALVSKIGLTVRGMYGEGSGSKASLYQLSNQVTLGISEESALSNLKSITGQILAKERATRQSLDRSKLEDMAWRALGVLASARYMSGEEFMKLISAVRLGAQMGILDIDKTKIARLMVDCQPAMLQLKACERELSLSAMEPMDRDRIRACLLRKCFSDLSFQ